MPAGDGRRRLTPHSSITRPPYPAAMLRVSGGLLIVLAGVAAAAVLAGPAAAADAARVTPVPSLEPRATQVGVAAARAAGDLPALRRRSRLPPGAGRLLRGHRLAAPRDQAGRDRLPVRPVLHLRAPDRRRQDEVATRPGLADPRARAELPCARGDPLHDVAEVGRRDRLLLVPGGRRGEAADGRGRLRRGRR